MPDKIDLEKPPARVKSRVRWLADEKANKSPIKQKDPFAFKKPVSESEEEDVFRKLNDILKGEADKTKADRQQKRQDNRERREFLKKHSIGKGPRPTPNLPTRKT